MPEAAQINGWHVLRHSAASERLSNGLSLAETAGYLGDTKQVVLSACAYFLPHDIDLAREIMNGPYSPAPSGEMPYK